MTPSLADHRTRPVDLTTLQKSKVEHRAKVAKAIAKRLPLVTASKPVTFGGDDQKYGPVTGACLVFVTPQGPIAVATYGCTWEEIRAAGSALTDGYNAARAGIKDYWGEARRRSAQRAKWAAEKEAEEAADRAARPWCCEFCTKRFKSERGATSHERQCWRNPDAVMYGPSGTHVATMRDGKVVASMRVQGPFRSASTTTEGVGTDADELPILR